MQTNFASVSKSGDLPDETCFQLQYIKHHQFSIEKTPIKSHIELECKTLDSRETNSMDH